MAAQEPSDSSGNDSEEEAYDDYTNNRDNINIARGRSDGKKEKGSSKEGKKGKGESDECVKPSSEAEEKSERLSKLKKILKTL